VAFNHSIRVRKNNNFKAGELISKSSKLLKFRSLQRHHMRQCGIAFQIKELRCLPKPPCQQSTNTLTWQGITHDTPKEDRTESHSSLAKLQCRNKWSTDSAAFLHKQHLLTITMFLFLRLSIVGSLPNTAVHVKKATRGGTLDFHMPRQGNPKEGGFKQ
jgi:hypothetical protein